MTSSNTKKFIPPKQGTREIHRSGWIVLDHETIIQDGFLIAENGIIKDIGITKPKEPYIDHGPGVFIPPLVNAHLHLELSALKNRLSFEKGFQAWVQALIAQRAALGAEELTKAASDSIFDLQSCGVMYVGEISTLGLTWPLLIQSGMRGVYFREFLGSEAKDEKIEKTETLSYSLAGHAPHTSSPDLLKTLKNKCRIAKLPFSIHVAESEAEMEFIYSKTGDWADFLTSRGIDHRSWKIGSMTPVAYLDSIGLLDPLTLAVHLLHLNHEDLNILENSGVRVCVCPRSNMNLHGKLPDIYAINQKGLEPALGTDSLASCDSLDLFDEMAFVADHYPLLDPCIIFSMATLYGAKALGLEKQIGTLSKGKKAEFLYLPVKIKHKKEIFEKIIFNKQ